MPTPAPPREVIDAIVSGDGIITRRAEFYEADGVTPWHPTEDRSPRLVSGSVSIDMGRAERRALDATFDNKDGALAEDPYNGLWYDKIVKIFRGVKYYVPYKTPRIAIIEDPNGTLQTAFRDIGITTAYRFFNADIVSDLSRFDIVVADSQGGVPAKAQLLRDAYDAGMSVMTISQVGDQTWLPFVTASAAKAADAIAYQMNPVTYDHPLSGAWTNQNLDSDAGKVITAFDVSATGVSTFLYNSATTYTHVIAGNAKGGKWFHQQNKLYNTTQTKVLWALAADWLHGFVANRSWEMQLGEFLIDAISEDHFPPLVKITARDYTKKCLDSKLTKTTMFASGSSITQLIRAVAANCGITKMIVPQFSETLQADTTFDKETDRWKIIVDLAAVVGHQPFFDNMGFLVIAPIPDPTLTPMTWTFGVGIKNPDGTTDTSEANLVSFSKSSSDARIKNYIAVTGEGDPDTNPLGYYGEAKNEDPNSPTRIKRLGERTWHYNGSMFTSDEQCIQFARAWLKIMSLEEYNISFSSIVFPWLDVSQIVLMHTGKQAAYEPTRFLLATLEIPLDLSPMSGTSRRVTIVGTTNESGEEVQSV